MFLGLYNFILLAATIAITQLLYKDVFKMGYLTELHLLAVYVVMIASTNNVLTYHGTWEQS